MKLDIVELNKSKEEIANLKAEIHTMKNDFASGNT